MQTVNEPLQHQPTQKGHYGYQYILRHGEALRVKLLGQVKETVYKNSPERVVIPKSLQLITLRFLHEGVVHIGKHRMMACISTRYSWIGMTSDVQSYNNNCRRCSLRKASNYGNNSIPLQRYPVACSPFE